MAGGENGAKATIKREVEDLVTVLQSGRKLTPAMIKRCLVLQFNMLVPLFENNFVTVEKCAFSHEELREEFEEAVADVVRKRPRLGWPGAVSVMVSVAALCGTALKLFGS